MAPGYARSGGEDASAACRSPSADANRAVLRGAAPPVRTIRREPDRSACRQSCAAAAPRRAKRRRAASASAPPPNSSTTGGAGTSEGGGGGGGGGGPPELVEELVDELVEELVDELVEELVELDPLEPLDPLDVVPPKLDEVEDEVAPEDVLLDPDEVDELPEDPVEPVDPLPPEDELDEELDDDEDEEELDEDDELDEALLPDEVETFPEDVDTLPDDVETLPDDVDTLPDEVLTPPVEVDTPPEVLEVEVDPVLVEDTTTLPPPPLDPPPKNPPKKPPPKPPKPPPPPITTGRLGPLAANTGCSAGGGGKGIGIGVGWVVTVTTLGSHDGASAGIVTRRTRLVWRTGVAATLRWRSGLVCLTWCGTAPSARGVSATCTAPPPISAPPAAQAHNFAKAMRTDIVSLSVAIDRRDEPADPASGDDHPSPKSPIKADAPTDNNPVNPVSHCAAVI